ncbi:MAG: arylsulfatase [Planctomycetes bacterium]|nr:arylsulfatase [Planctomycetota bacterium]
MFQSVWARIAFAGFVLAAFVMSATGADTPAGERLPNIVFFLADDMGYGDVHCLNPDSKIPTPHMDRLAAEGMVFRDAHSPSAVCSPTRYGILTGRYAWRTQLKRGVLVPWDRPLIEAGRLTMPAMLREHGYATACIGKWHLGWDWPTRDGRPVADSLRHARSDSNLAMKDYEVIDCARVVANGPLTRGFDSYFGTDVPNYPPYCFIDNDRTIGIPTQLKPGRMFGNPGPMVPGWRLEPILPTLGARAVTFIDEHAAHHRDQPFFLYFASTAPHTPIVPDDPFVGKSQAGPCGDLVYQVDWTLGQILAALDRNGMRENTIVVMTSDNGSPAIAGDLSKHGPDLSSRGASIARFGHNPNAPWRGMKADIWEGGHHMPLFVRWPGRVAAGSTCGQTVCLTDFMATFAARVGHRLPNDAAEDSYDLSRLLFGKEEREPVREATVHHSVDGVFAVRQGKWKLIMSLGSGGWSKPAGGKPEPGGPKGQLYDMQADPAETKNLWIDHPDVVERLTLLLEKYQREGRSVPRRN